MSVTLPSATRAFLDERRFATLATIAEDGAPQLTVMWYLRRGDTIIVNTEAGRTKDRHLRRDQRVALCVEDGYRYVSLNATVRIIDDQHTAHADIHELTIRYADPGTEDAFYDRNFRDCPRVSYVLTIDRLRSSGIETGP